MATIKRTLVSRMNVSDIPSHKLDEVLRKELRKFVESISEIEMTVEQNTLQSEDSDEKQGDR